MTCPKCGAELLESADALRLSLGYTIPAKKYECVPCGYTRVIPQQVAVPGDVLKDPEPPKAA